MTAKKVNPKRKKTGGRKKIAGNTSPWSPRYRTHFQVQTIESVSAALRKYKGNLSAVARAHGVTPGATHAFVHEYHPDVLLPVMNEARREVIDHVEYNLFDMAEAGDPWAMTKVLEALGRDRGYGRQLALTGGINPDGTDRAVQISIVLPDNFRTGRPATEAIADSESEAVADDTDGTTIRFPAPQTA